MRVNARKKEELLQNEMIKKTSGRNNQILINQQK
jgi:hypothetical protein